MKLNELPLGYKIIVQINLGEQQIEFESVVIERDMEGVVISPYMHQGQAIKLNVDAGNGIICNIFADDPDNMQRISWKNVEVKTKDGKTGPVYVVKTRGFNTFAKQDERRKNSRVMVRRNGHVTDSLSGVQTDVLIHDISDVGISFYAPKTFSPKSNKFLIEFTDAVEGKDFDIKVECNVARVQDKPGMDFYGCRVTTNKDFILYGFMRRMHRRPANAENGN